MTWPSWQDILNVTTKAQITKAKNKRNELRAVTALMSSISASRSSKGASTVSRKEALRQAATRATEARTQVTYCNEATGEGS